MTNQCEAGEEGEVSTADRTSLDWVSGVANTHFEQCVVEELVG